MSKQSKIAVIPVEHSSCKRRVVVYRRPDFREWGLTQEYPEDFQPFVNGLFCKLAETLFGIERTPDGIKAFPEDETRSLHFSLRIFNMDMPNKAAKKLDPLDLRVSLWTSGYFEADIDLEISISELIRQELLADCWDETDSLRDRHLRLAKELRSLAEQIESFVAAKIADPPKDDDQS